MSRFAVYDNPGGAGFLLDVQTDLLGSIGTRIVVPLLPPNGLPEPTRRLNQRFAFRGEDYIMATQLLAAVEERELTVRRGGLSHHQDEITAALDMIFQRLLTDQ